MFVRVIPELSLTFSYSFVSIFIPLLTKYLVESLVNSGALFINYSVPALRAAYGKATSNSRRIPPDCIILRNWVFENFLWTDKLFVKALRIFEKYVSVNNSLGGKLVSSFEFPIKFYERFKVTSVLFFIPDLTY